MTKTLTTHGNSAALIIEKPVLELLGITMDTPLKISTDGRKLIIEPVRDPKMKGKILKARKWLHKKHGKTLRKLAK